MEQTRLEREVFRVMHLVYGDWGFPEPEDIYVTKRINTGVGRFSDLESSATLGISEGFIDLGGQFIEMDGVKYGLMAVVCVEQRIVKYLEIVAYGHCVWDGEERPWTFRS